MEIEETPFALLDRWMAEASTSEPSDPDAMALATADARGRPSVRLVLLKEWGPDGFVFYTNRESRKGIELAANPWASGVLHWKSLRRQVRVEGPVEPLSEAASDAYFQTRARQSRIGAWASKQSTPMEGRFEFEGRLARYAARFAVGTVPRPPFWGGYRIVPSAVELWENREFRLHERVLWSREATGRWSAQPLYP